MTAAVDTPPGGAPSAQPALQRLAGPERLSPRRRPGGDDGPGHPLQRRARPHARRRGLRPLLPHQLLQHLRPGPGGLGTAVLRHPRGGADPRARRRAARHGARAARAGHGAGRHPRRAHRLGARLRRPHHRLLGRLHRPEPSLLPRPEVRHRLPRPGPHGARRHGVGGEPGGGAAPGGRRALARPGPRGGGRRPGPGRRRGAGRWRCSSTGGSAEVACASPGPPPGRSWSAGTAIVAIELAVYVQPYLDAVLLSKMVPTDVVGWYGAAKTIMGTLLAPSLILGAAAYPRLSRAAVDRNLFRREFATAQRPMLWLGGLGGVGTWMFADFAIHLVYGHRRLRTGGAGAQDVRAGDCSWSSSTSSSGPRSPPWGGPRPSPWSRWPACSSRCRLEVLLIPRFQARLGNGGVGVTLAAAISEVVMFAGGLALMPRGTVGRAVFLDGARALGAAAGDRGGGPPRRAARPLGRASRSASSPSPCSRSPPGLLRRDDLRFFRELLGRRPLAVGVLLAGAERGGFQVAGAASLPEHMQ